MDKTIAGMLGALGTLALAQGAHAAAAPVSMDAVMQASSYADLLKPIPNAAELLANDTTPPAESPAITLVQYHHHHHRVVRCYWHHHHRVCRTFYR